jgi:hypothetical protein
LPQASASGFAPTVRLWTVKQIALEKGLTWLKVYRVSPATATMPETSLYAAEQMVDQTGSVSLHVSGLLASSAIRTVASADDAAVEFSSPLGMGRIDADLSGASIAEAIASMAKFTHTHWSMQYMIGAAYEPAFVAQLERSRTLSASRAIASAESLDGPFIFHATPVSAMPAGSTEVVAQSPADIARERAAANASQQPNPYNYYNNQPQPYQAAPGVIVQPGNPYGDSTIVMGGSTHTSF